MPVGTLLRNITSRELTEWQIYFRLQREEMDKAKKPETDMKTNIIGQLGGIQGTKRGLKRRK